MPNPATCTARDNDVLCALLLPTNSRFKSLNDYISGNLNWSVCGAVCMDGATAITGQFFGFTTLVRETMLDVKSTHCTIHNTNDG